MDITEVLCWVDIICIFYIFAEVLEVKRKTLHMVRCGVSFMTMKNIFYSMGDRGLEAYSLSTPLWFCSDQSPQKHHKAFRV